MSARTRRHLELLALAQPLRRYAGSLQRPADANATSFLVHQALAAAFAEPPDLRASDQLESALRADIDRRLAAGAAIHDPA
jgi:hypothetical protein